ncbi:MAG: hypothetical protein ACTHMS_21110 [Jatrophihabitans sp.]|uniref:hypothetical protein n=1 Tax=Jatrophihabitans sp. TaxID=1932789 RepID=UPI003F7E2EA7
MSTDTSPSSPAVTVTSLSSVWVVDGAPDYHVGPSCRVLSGRSRDELFEIPLGQATEDGFTPCGVCSLELAAAAPSVPSVPPADASAAPAASGTVLVVDGFPDYHSAGCVALVGKAEIGIPLQQAVEDGFTACRLCIGATASAPAATGGRGSFEQAFTAPASINGNGNGAHTTGTASVWVVDGEPDYHRRACTTLAGKQDIEVPFDQAVEDGFQPCVVCRPTAAVVDTPPAAAEPAAATVAPPVAPPSAPAAAVTDSDTVLVVDGKPEYHVTGCRRLSGEDAIAIPRSQAVEDGFAPCGECRPATGGTDSTPTVPALRPDAVWVVDGEPQYHPEGCRDLIGKAAVAIPLDQATEDGFTACAHYGAAAQPAETATKDVAPAQDSAPVTEAPAAEPPAVPASSAGPVIGADEVVVVDGKPDYHRADCSTLTGQATVAIPRTQAVGDGFRPCTVCTPDGGEAAHADRTPPAEPAAGAAVEQAWVVDGYAHYHQQGCPTLTGLPAEPLPLQEAIELGFAPCTVCSGGTAETPAAGPAATTDGAVAPADPQRPAAAATGADEDTVWVVDGYLNFHRQGCVRIAGAEAIAIPLSQATEDGFQPCGFCRPTGADADEALAADESLRAAELPPAAATGHDQVWVVDGQPLYHAQGCSRIAGESAIAIPYAQATEDGFQRCDVCLGSSTDAAASAEAAAAPAEAPAAAPVEASAAEAPAAESPAGTGSVAPVEPEAPAASVDLTPPPAAADATAIAEAPAPHPDAEPIAEAAVTETTADESATPEHEAAVSEAPAAVEQQPAAVEEAAEPVATATAAPEATEATAAPEVPAASEAPAAPEAAAPAAAAPVQPSAPAGAEPAAQVFVVDGRPRYHRADCVIVKGVATREVAREQAIEEGFKPCSICTPGS